MRSLRNICLKSLSDRSNLIVLPQLLPTETVQSIYDAVLTSTLGDMIPVRVAIREKIYKISVIYDYNESPLLKRVSHDFHADRGMKSGGSYYYFYGRIGNFVEISADLSISALLNDNRSGVFIIDNSNIVFSKSGLLQSIKDPLAMIGLFNRNCNLGVYQTTEYYIVKESDLCNVLSICDKYPEYVSSTLYVPRHILDICE